MHQPLENYLNRIKSQLKGIPAEERDLQMREIAQHLQRLVSEEVANGLSETDAVLAAIAQFGEPKEIGRGIRAATGGTKTGVWLGMAMGACVGVSILQIQWLMPLFMGVPYWSISYPLVSPDNLIEVALGGALASLVGRSYTWRTMMKPSGRLTVFGSCTRGVAVCCRFMEVGMFRGGVGGAVFTFCSQIWGNYTSVLQWNAQFPKHPEGFALFKNFLDLPNLPFWMGAGAAQGAFVVGILYAFIGARHLVSEKGNARRSQLI